MRKPGIYGGCEFIPVILPQRRLRLMKVKKMIRQLSCGVAAD